MIGQQDNRPTPQNQGWCPIKGIHSDDVVFALGRRRPVMTTALPKLTSLDGFDPGLASILRPTVERLGYLGEFFQLLAPAPQPMIGFIEHGKAVRALLSNGVSEVVALAVCSAIGDRYERIQHERLALTLGFSPDWIAAACGKEGLSEELLAPDERKARRLALAMLRDHGRGVADELRAVVEELGAERTLAVLWLVTRFITIATLCLTLGVQLPVPSIFEAAA